MTSQAECLLFVIKVRVSRIGKRNNKNVISRKKNLFILATECFNINKSFNELKQNHAPQVVKEYC